MENRGPSIANQKRAFFVIPTGPGTGLTSVSLGLVRAWDRQGLGVGFYKPIIEDERFNITHYNSQINRPPLLLEQALEMDRNNLIEEISEIYDELSADIVIIEGLIPVSTEIELLHSQIVQALDAQVIIITTLDSCSKMESVLHHNITKTARFYEPHQIFGVVVNKLNAPCGRLNVPLMAHPSFYDHPEEQLTKESLQRMSIFKTYKLLATIPYQEKLLRTRTSDLADHLGARVILEGQLSERRVETVSLVARTLPNYVSRLRPDTLIIAPGDRDDVLLACCLAEANGVTLAGLILTGGIPISPNVWLLCERSLRQTGLPILSTADDSYVAATKAASMDRRVPVDDMPRLEKVMDRVASSLDLLSLPSSVTTTRRRLSPPAFLHQLACMARRARKRIVLPEGDDPRILRAAVKCQERQIAHCVLLGKPEEIQIMANALGITIPDSLEIIEPTAEIRERYVDEMVRLRKHKGMTDLSARAQLEDITVLATMMLAVGEVDGLVSGARHTTANTIRPALQLIKARSDARIVSSIFFMCLPDQVVLYGDCAINPDPNPEELASIALESANSAEAFGIEPRVAMLSYSTGNSGSGSDVDKVREATRLVKEERPDLPVDGPLQYDAACEKDVAEAKAPNSPVAGKATVLVFPDLNTGNTTYKAVQRTAHVVCVGPMLQGLNRPVNDLSRGALVDDIIYTIALTAIQAEQTEKIKMSNSQRHLPMI